MKLTAGESNVKISVIDSKHTLYKVAKAGSIGVIATKGSQNTFGEQTQEIKREPDLKDEEILLNEEKSPQILINGQKSSTKEIESKPKQSSSKSYKLKEKSRDSSK